jgi:hypothetical protein
MEYNLKKVYIRGIKVGAGNDKTRTNILLKKKIS